jgi:hypothetical protein
MRGTEDGGRQGRRNERKDINLQHGSTADAFAATAPVPCTRGGSGSGGGAAAYGVAAMPWRRPRGAAWRGGGSGGRRSRAEWLGVTRDAE